MMMMTMAVVLRAGKTNTSTNIDTDTRQATTIAKVEESDRYILVLLRLLFVYFFRFLFLPFLSWPHFRLHISLVFRSRILFNPDKNIISIKTLTHRKSDLRHHPGRSSIRRVGHHLTESQTQTTRNGPRADVFNLSNIYIAIQLQPYKQI